MSQAAQRTPRIPDAETYFYQGRISYSTKNHLRMSECLLTIYERDPFAIAIATELHDNPGASVASTVDSVAGHVCQFFGLDPARLVLIERHCSVSYKGPTYSEYEEEQLTLVKFQDRNGYEFARPTFVAVDPELLDRLFV